MPQERAEPVHLGVDVASLPEPVEDCPRGEAVAEIVKARTAPLPAVRPRLPQSGPLADVGEAAPGRVRDPMAFG